MSRKAAPAPVLRSSLAAVPVWRAHGPPQPVAGVPHAGLVGDVGKAKAAQVAIEAVAWRHVDLRPPQGSPVEEVDVDPTVAVVIERGQTRGDRFHDVAFSAAAVGVPEVDPRFSGDV